MSLTEEFEKRLKCRLTEIRETKTSGLVSFGVSNENDTRYLSYVKRGVGLKTSTSKSENETIGTVLIDGNYVWFNPDDENVSSSCWALYHLRAYRQHPKLPILHVKFVAPQKKDEDEMKLSDESAKALAKYDASLLVKNMVRTTEDAFVNFGIENSQMTDDTPSPIDCLNAFRSCLIQGEFRVSEMRKLLIAKLISRQKTHEAAAMIRKAIQTKIDSLKQEVQEIKQTQMQIARQKALETSPALTLLFQDLVVNSKTMSEEQFWEEHKDSVASLAPLVSASDPSEEFHACPLTSLIGAAAGEKGASPPVDESSQSSQMSSFPLALVPPEALAAILSENPDVLARYRTHVLGEETETGETTGVGKKMMSEGVFWARLLRSRLYARMTGGDLHEATFEPLFDSSSSLDGDMTSKTDPSSLGFLVMDNLVFDDGNRRQGHGLFEDIRDAGLTAAMATTATTTTSKGSVNRLSGMLNLSDGDMKTSLGDTKTSSSAREQLAIAWRHQERKTQFVGLMERFNRFVDQSVNSRRANILLYEGGGDATILTETALEEMKASDIDTIDNLVDDFATQCQELRQTRRSEMTNYQDLMTTSHQPKKQTTSNLKTFTITTKRTNTQVDTFAYSCALQNVTAQLQQQQLFDRLDPIYARLVFVEGTRLLQSQRNQNQKIEFERSLQQAPALVGVINRIADIQHTMKELISRYWKSDITQSEVRERYLQALRSSRDELKDIAERQEDTCRRLPQNIAGILSPRVLCRNPIQVVETLLSNWSVNEQKCALRVETKKPTAETETG